MIAYGCPDCAPAMSCARHERPVRVAKSARLSDGSIAVSLDGDVVAQVYAVPGVDSEQLSIEITDLVYAWVRKREWRA